MPGDREAIGAGELLERRGGGLLGRMRQEVIAYELDRCDVDRRGAVVASAAERVEDVGEYRCDLHACEVAHRLVDVGQQGSDAACRRNRLLHRVRDERQRAAAERFANQRRCDVEDPVAEAVGGSRRAVVRLVGMENMQLTRKADSCLCGSNAVA